MPIYDWCCPNDPTHPACETVLRVVQVTNPEFRPSCKVCGVPMVRDYQKEHGFGVLDEGCREKGVFPYTDERIDDGKGGDMRVESRKHLKEIMAERNLVFREEISDGAKDRIRAGKRRYF